MAADDSHNEKVPCSPIGASPIPIAATNPGADLSEIVTGGTELQNLKFWCHLIRARVIAATGPVQSFTDATKGSLPAHFPWDAIGSRTARNSSTLFLRHRFTTDD